MGFSFPNQATLSLENKQLKQFDNY